MLHLPRKVTLVIDPCRIWDVISNARSNRCHGPTSANTAPATKNESHAKSSSHMKHSIYNARSNKCHPPTSPNTAPATQNDSHDETSSHMKRYLQCAEQQMPLSNLTTCCACHEKWLSWSNLFTHETLFTMRGVRNVTLQAHQILRLPQKNHPPKSKRNLLKTDETSFPMRGRSETVPTMIREWNRQSATRLATEVTFHADQQHFVLKNTTFRAPAIFPNFTEYCACHKKKCHCHFTKYCACHAKWLSWSDLFTHETLFTMCGATDAIVEPHQILRLPRKMLYSTLSLLYSTLLYSTLLYATLLYSTLLYFTLLYSTLLYSTLLYSTLLYSTLPYFTLLYFTLLYFTLLYSTLLYSTLLYFTLLYFTLLYFTLLYFTLLYFTLLDFTLLYFTLPYFTLLYFTLLYFTLLYFTLLYSTRLYSTLLYSTRLYSTLLYSTLYRRTES